MDGVSSEDSESPKGPDDDMTLSNFQNEAKLEALAILKRKSIILNLRLLK